MKKLLLGSLLTVAVVFAQATGGSADTKIASGKKATPAVAVVTWKRGQFAS